MKFRLNPHVALLAGLAFCTSAPVSAASVNDVSAWFAEFRDAAGDTNADRMDQLINDAKDPRLNSPQLETAISDFIKSIQNGNLGPAEYTDIIEDKSIGNTLQRETIAAIYDSHPLFYQITFLKEQDGWKVIFVNLNTDINKALQAEWPRW